jgi:ribosomal protein S18 acetylase RimI-like enzyme
MADIREYSPTDYPKVRKNLEEAGIYYENLDSQDTYDELAMNPNGLVLVAANGSDIAGNVVAQKLGFKTAFMWGLAVASDYRRQGIATELVETTEDLLKEQGVKEIHGYVQVTNERSLRLFHKLGYMISWDHKFYGPRKVL